MSRSNQIRLSFPKENALAWAKAELLWDAAPNTCAALAEAGPFTGQCHHAIYSGSECVLLLDRVLRLEQENATSQVTKGDVAFAWFPAGSGYGVKQDFSEICWFYDIDAQPRMWEGSVDVNVFARMIQPADEFVAICFRMRREGVKPFKIEFV